MAHGDYDGPQKHDKGLEGGSCNRTLCQTPGAIWYNHGSYAWYCADCRRDIQFDSFNLRDWRQNWQPRLGHPMFETREMMVARGGASKLSPTPSPAVSAGDAELDALVDEIKFEAVNSEIDRGLAGRIITALRAQQAPAEGRVKPLTLSELRPIWKKHGGSWHGPRVEHWIIPERNIEAFFAELIGGEA